MHQHIDLSFLQSTDVASCRNVIELQIVIGCRTSQMIWCADLWLTSIQEAILSSVMYWFSLTDGFNYFSGLLCHYLVCLAGSRRVHHRINAVCKHPTQLIYCTCYSVRHALPYWTFIFWWISIGFIPSLLKKQVTERCSSVVYIASGAATKS